MVVLLHLARQQEGEAAKALKQMLPLSRKVRAGAPGWTYWPEMTAAYSAVARPGTREAAKALLDPIHERIKY